MFAERLVPVVPDVVDVIGEGGTSGTDGKKSEKVPVDGEVGDRGDICAGRTRSYEEVRRGLPGLRSLPGLTGSALPLNEGLRRSGTRLTRSLTSTTCALNRFFRLVLTPERE